ncbi:hypothetical protein THAOC_10286 [Thalassiosira oceanica]|uniref:Uncharacterized protein n=1 Tax=Thalassiosira oceanica TaxID=159749 RepID=K0SQD2_THAOC|nr:hypothetical protein THAOC_10286 [Thalassiosira oceanica]|eukprot:EJK68523.1 hypothetical protein THAOC_10286 [Thalassiosira oceanica]
MDFATISKSLRSSQTVSRSQSTNLSAKQFLAKRTTSVLQNRSAPQIPPEQHCLSHLHRYSESAASISGAQQTLMLFGFL